jgi:hypothetical protein
VPGAVDTWTVEDVLAWLASRELKAHIERFQKHNVDGNALLKLRLRDLQQMGVVVC